ncbi:MAG: glycosyltransferase family 2 protein, partial [Chloroflexi bacterium]|nr:glycosyltransferase family 2 protein [Chloroflexota bacterium]
LSEAARDDARVNVVTLERNLGISGNSNAAVKHARGEFIALLDHDDVLAPFALYEVARVLNQDRDWDVLYSDNDVLTADGRARLHPLFKPDWSPAIMLSANYMTHLTLVRTALMREVGGFCTETDGAQDWDLFLRLSEHTTRIAHIPQILYHWRDAPQSTAMDTSRKPYAREAQLQVIGAYLLRQGLHEGRAFMDRSGFIRVEWSYDQTRLVSIIVPSNGANALLRRCVTSILERTRYPNFEIVVVNNGARRAREFANFARWQEDARVCVVDDERAFNYSAVNNFGARNAHGDVLVFLNNDTEVLSPDWLDEILMWLEREEVGVLGAKLLLPNGSIQHAGVVLGLDGFAGHVFAGDCEGRGTIFGFAEWYRDYLAVTGACLATRRALFEQVGGFDESFLLCGSDVELCLRVREAGYRVVYNPFVRLKHHESATRGDDVPASDFRTSFPHYLPYLQNGDPYFN